MPNRLIHEKSLYLRQHAENPVDWWPWGEEALAEARRQCKPILVSIGYSSCHWCHVMARESFEQPWIADLMNQHYICIKVDREERPEVDKLMMNVAIMIKSNTGWPLNCFCLPDGRPFFAGTYFPPEDRGQGQTPWPQLLMRVYDAFLNNVLEVSSNANAIEENLAHLSKPMDADGCAPSVPDLLSACQKICKDHDDKHGGFGTQPKFPSPHLLNFLMAVRSLPEVKADETLATRIDDVVFITLVCMSQGGIYDQIGGGFHRYSVDCKWTIPHYEKMLYDSAQLLGTYAEAWARYRHPIYADICAETVAWLWREMMTSNGLFAASLDADTDHQEGITYLWTASEISQALGEETKAFEDAYDVCEEGNLEGRNILTFVGDYETRIQLASAREKLLSLRALKNQPARDEKVLLSWNAILVSNLAKAGWILNRKDWVEKAIEIENRLWNLFFDERSNCLRSVGYGNQAFYHSNLNDYANLAEAELTLASYASWVNPGKVFPYAQRAEQILTIAIKLFNDPHAVGAFNVVANRNDLSVRPKDWFDNALPAGNSSLLHCFGQMALLSADPQWSQRYTELTTAYSGICKQIPSSIAHALDGMARNVLGYVSIKSSGSWDALREALLGTAEDAPDECAYRPIFLITDPSVSGYSVCTNQTCYPTVQTAQEAVALL